MKPMGRSFCVRSSETWFPFFPPISFAASETAPDMSLRLLTIPMIPAIAIPPIPMLLAYLKICSAEAIAAVTPSCTSTLGKMKAMPGTITHQTRAEPQQMMKAYLSPTMYPKPRTAAPVLHLNTSLAFSATVSPHNRARLVKFSCQRPNVATTKSYRPPSKPAISNGLA